MVTMPRVAQRRGGSGFLRKPALALGTGGLIGRQDFECNVGVESCIAHLVDRTHPPLSAFRGLQMGSPSGRHQRLSVPDALIGWTIPGPTLKFEMALWSYAEANAEDRHWVSLVVLLRLKVRGLGLVISTGWRRRRRRFQWSMGTILLSVWIIGLKQSGDGRRQLSRLRPA